jgi:2',3'-cyclic-nucleotide 2'-phosphodiesterase (5'-nucleotidase family)
MPRGYRVFSLLGAPLTAAVTLSAACGSGPSSMSTTSGAAGGYAGSGSSTSTGSSSTSTGGPPGTLIRLIHYNDLHAHLVPHPTLVADPPGQYPATAKVAVRGGIARLATKIAALRAEAPSLLMNIGDTYHGGVEALYTQGEAVAAAVNALGIDVGVPGNWDYAYGPGITRLRYTGKATTGILKCVQEGIAKSGGGFPGAPTLPSLTPPSFPNLAANVTYTGGPGAKPGDPFLPATLVKEVAGVKVGFIGLSSDIVPKMHPMLACGLSFLGAEQMANGDAAGWTSAYQSLVETQAQALRAQGATVVVVMSELGLQKNYWLANAIAPGAVDVVFSAHTHEAVFTPLTSKSGALVVEAGDDTYVGHMDIRVAGGAVTSRDWTLEAVDDSIPEDPTVKALVDAARAPFLVPDPNLTISGNTGAQLALHQPITTVVGTTLAPLTRKNALDSSFNEFFTEALRTRAGTTLGMSPGFRFDSPIATASSLVEGPIVADGSVTIEDAYRFFPVIYKMGTATISGGALGELLEDAMEDVFSTSIPMQGGGWLEGFAGFSASVSLAAGKGQRVLSMALPGGTPVAASTSYSIAGCRRPYDAPGVLCSHTGFSNVQDLMKTDGSGQPWTDVEIFIDGLQHAPSLHPAKVFTDTSGTPLWPQDPFVQPLQGAQ